jgi:hypothetical protein
MPEWITLDYLELFCEKHQLVIGCRGGDEELWISALGPHPSGLTSAEVRDILTDSPLFEVRTVTGDEEYDSSIPDSIVVTRAELEQRIRRMMN